MQTSMCAPRDRERSRVLAHTDATATIQEEEDAVSTAGSRGSPGSPGREECHQDEVSSLPRRDSNPREEDDTPAPAGRRRRRPTRRRPPSRNQGLLPGQQPTEEPIRRGDQREAAIRIKVMKCLHSGMGGNEVYKPTFAWYDRMLFLIPHIASKSSKSNLDLNPTYSSDDSQHENETILPELCYLAAETTSSQQKKLKYRRMFPQVSTGNG
ncbi:uncharacterized protein [Anabrus simplex]|uniref:uncharacterized protein n=1 Tax=Anabrus simplex TaxID=316456 RepID=UPI0035A365DA